MEFSQAVSGGCSRALALGEQQGSLLPPLDHVHRLGGLQGSPGFCFFSHLRSAVCVWTTNMSCYLLMGAFSSKSEQACEHHYNN